jgi:hypothetical protein
MNNGTLTQYYPVSDGSPKLTVAGLNYSCIRVLPVVVNISPLHVSMFSASSSTSATLNVPSQQQQLRTETKQSIDNRTSQTSRSSTSPAVAVASAAASAIGKNASTSGCSSGVNNSHNGLMIRLIESLRRQLPLIVADVDFAKVDLIKAKQHSYIGRYTSSVDQCDGYIHQLLTCRCHVDR